MHLRRSLARSRGLSTVLTRGLAAALAAVVLAGFTSCGFNYATDREYTPGVGANDRDSGVDVLAAVIVASEDGAGTFIASFANNDQEEPATVGTVESEGSTIEVEEVEVPPGGLVNLAEDGGFAVEGEFGLGDRVPMTIGFGSGESVTLDVPVVANCGDYAGLDGPGEEECEIPEPVEH